MTKYLIKATGCDASTRVIVELTDDEFAAAQKIATAVTEASWSGCEPRLAVREANQLDIEDYEETLRERAEELVEEEQK